MGEVVREEGAIAAFVRAFARISRFIYHREHYLIFSRNVKDFEGAHGSADVPIISLITTSEMEAAPHDVIEAVSPLRKLLNRHLMREGMLFCIIMNKIMVHQSWVATSACKTVDRIAPHMRYERTAYIGRCETLPACRGQGLYKHVLFSICGVLASKGFVEAVLTVAPDNQSSIAGVKKAGFHKKGEGELITLLGISYWRQVKGSR
ncbi:MAG: GNAT family N-acetyltransferase [Syntrophus sp. (in: bacteria)]